MGRSTPDDLSCLSSLQDLDLSRNNFTHLPDSISQLSTLKRLTLNDCSRLQSLPVLPLNIGFLKIKRCPLLQNYSNQFVAWTSGETRFTLVDSDCRDRALYPLPSSYEGCEPFFERYIEVTHFLSHTHEHTHNTYTCALNIYELNAFYYFTGNNSSK